MTRRPSARAMVDEASGCPEGQRPADGDWTLLFITLFALLSSVRVWLVRDVIWDDNCWLQISYATSSLQEFLDLGFVELRRESLGIALYPLLSLHKSGPFFYAVWHSLDMLTEIGSPILLYLFVRQVVQSRSIGFASALAFVALHLDHTLGYVSAINYRIGLLLALLSLYLTVRGVGGSRASIPCLVGALAAAWVGNYVFMEALVALEPARLLLIGYLLFRRTQDLKQSALHALLIGLPFLTLGALLIAYKLLFKPFGLYDGAYAHLFRWDEIGKNLAALPYFERRELAHAFRLWTLGSVFAGACAGLLSFWIFAWNWPSQQEMETAKLQAPLSSTSRRFTALLDAHRAALWIGLAFLFFPVVLLLYANRALGGNMNSSHAAPLQIGWSMLAGTLLWAGYSAVTTRPGLGKPAAIAVISGMLGLGTLANNKYVDLYLQSWQEQTTFWQAFVARFPTLPKSAIVFFDVEDGAEFSDLRIYYDFEFQMNLLYGAEIGKAGFHQFRAYTMEEYRRLPDRSGGSLETLERETHFGKERLQPKDFIVVRYRPGEFLINREILASHPEVSYRAWLDKSVPAVSSLGVYPLRRRVESPP